MDKIKEKNIHNKIDAGPVFFVAPNPNRAIGLEKHINNYHIVCSHDLDITEYLKEDGVPVLCIDDDSIKNTGKLLENERVLKYIRSNSAGETPNIITFKPSPKIEKICKANNFNYIGNDWRLNRKFENKVNFVEISKKLKIPNAGSAIVKLQNTAPVDEFFQEGGKSVVQFPRGYSGNSTFMVDSKSDFERLSEEHPGRNVKIARYLPGETYTINGCVGNNNVYVGRIIYQITGLTDFNGNRLGTSGNDYVYPEILSADARKKIYSYTKIVGKHMKNEGYRGIFGLDFIVEDGNVDLIEINPRLVGSVPVYTKLQIRNGEIPFLAVHLMEFLRGKKPDKAPKKQSYASWKKENSFKASQLILRNVLKKSTIIEKTFASGIYKAGEGKLEFQNKGYYIGRMLEEDEVLIQCIREGSVVNPDMEYANIQSGCGIIKAGKLSPRFAAIVDLVLRDIRIKEVI